MKRQKTTGPGVATQVFGHVEPKRVEDPPGSRESPRQTKPDRYMTLDEHLFALDGIKRRTKS